MATWRYHWLIMRECESYSNLKTTLTLFPWPDEDHIIPRTCSLDLAHLSKGVLKSPPGGMLHPLHFIKGLISQKPCRSPPLPYIFLFLHIQWHQPGTPWAHAPPPLFNENPDISETIQIPTPKQYIFFFLNMLRHIHWQGCPSGGMMHPFHFI